MGREASTSSGLLTSTATVTDKPALVHVINVSPGTAAGSVIVYEGTDATGTVLAKIPTVANGDGGCCAFDSPVNANNGIHVVLAGTGVEAVVHYSLQ